MKNVLHFLFESVIDNSVFERWVKLHTTDAGTERWRHFGWRRLQNNIDIRNICFLFLHPLLPLTLLIQISDTTNK